MMAHEGKKRHMAKKYFRFVLFWICFAICSLTFELSSIAAVISNEELTSLSDSSMVITWTTSDEAATTQIEYGVGGLTNTSSVAGTTKYHYLELTGLLPNTTYNYRVKSNSTNGTTGTFTTLARPTGDYLFSFAVLSDPRYAEGKSDSYGGRGIPYTKCAAIITSEVADINNRDVAFTVINGNLAENSATAAQSGNLIGTSFKTKLDSLTSASDLPPNVSAKYLPTAGYEDRTANYASNWITEAFKPLTTDVGSTESRYGYNAGDKDKDSIFNYQFKYHHYNFVFLDSTKDDGTSLASIEALNNYLSAESNTKTFVFSSYPAYDPLNSPTQDYPLAIPTSEIGGSVCLSNHVTFRSTLESYVDSQGNPIVAAVISGHLGDNYLRTIEAISYVRQCPAVAYPTGYSIYKVYTNGYVKSFYKTSGRDASDKPYYELARDVLSAEAGIPADVLAAFWLGSIGGRNFTFTYPFIPGIAPQINSTSPASSETGVALNRPLVIRFNKRMTTTDLNNWLTISPSAGNLSASFLDSGRTILSISHSADFVVGTTYNVTIDATYAKDEGLTPLASNYTFAFDTVGGAIDTNPPTAYIYPLANDSSDTPSPSFLGIASDESGVTNVQYKFDNLGSWLSAEATDGTFNASIENFTLSANTPLAIGTHQLWLKTTDGAGNTSAEGFIAYTFSVFGDRPNISVNINGSRKHAGDSINSTPKFEIVVSSGNSLESGNLTVDQTVYPLTFVRDDTNYYATKEGITLTDGYHGISIEAFDIVTKASTYEIYPLQVQSGGSLAALGTPLNYPNPFNPAIQTTSIGYSLSKDANITLSIFDLHGSLISRNSYSAGQNGGKAGYNEVTWDGKNTSGSVVGNGIYIYLLVSDGAVLSNGRGKLTVFK